MRNESSWVGAWRGLEAGAVAPRSLSNEVVLAVQNLADDGLSRWIEGLNRRKLETDVTLLVCLSEIERRKLYREEACPSFFEYLTRRLGYSEDVAYRRMWCSRLLRDYPLIHELLREGRIHQAALLLLKPHLTAENHRERLMAAAGKSKREVERLVASFNPKPDVPSRIRRVPAAACASRALDADGARDSGSALGSSDALSGVESSHPSPSLKVPDSDFAAPSLSPSPPLGTSAVAVPSAVAMPSAVVSCSTLVGLPVAVPSAVAMPSAVVSCSTLVGLPVAVTASSVDVRGRKSDENRTVEAAVAVPSASLLARSGNTVALRQAAIGGPASPGARPLKVTPLSESTYRVSFTATERLKGKLEYAGDLLSHVLKPSDLPEVIERALDLLIEQEQHRRFGVPRKGPNSRRARNSPETAVTDMKGVTKENAVEVPENGKNVRSIAAVGGSQFKVNHVATVAEFTMSANSENSDNSPSSIASSAPIALDVVFDGAATLPSGLGGRLSSYIPSAIRRAVWERDGGRCTFVSVQGDRCGCRHHLQFDHRVARALGGAATFENLRLRCAAHNALAAEQVFGKEQVAVAMADARGRVCGGVRHLRKNAGHEGP